MALSRNVWLPGAAVWACLPHTPELLPCPAQDLYSRKSKDGRLHDQELHGEFPRKRRKSSSPRASSDVATVVESRPQKLALVDAESEAEAEAPGLGLTMERKEVTMCPICLCNIEDGGGAALQWCMHRFCAHCIEEWSRVCRLCPLCKAEFRGWYHGVQSNSKFSERLLPPIAELSTRRDTAANHARSRFHGWRRQERGRGKMPPRRQGVAPDTAAASSVGRSMPFPTQRCFGLPKEHQSAQAMRDLEKQAAAKTLQWRQSIYNRNLIARPFELRRKSTGIKDAKAERRLEPWIHRELQALLPDSDHDVLVRLVLGLWFGMEDESSLRPERLGRSGGPSTRHGSTGGTAEKAVTELKRFLGDKAEVFWHELRCFAESPFTMRAYDTIVVYTRHGNSRLPISKVNRKSSYQDRPRRGSDSALPSSTSMPRHDGGPGHLERNHQIPTSGRQSISHGCTAEGRSQQHQQDTSLNRSSRADHQKKPQHMNAIPIAEHRWQLSYC